MKAGTPVIVTLLDCSKAFDKCQFDQLFQKLLDKKVPAVVVRMLIYVYTEQVAWVKWGNEVSSPFRILNGTRQGSVLSPALFSVYIDDMIQDLRKLGLGCYMGGLWIGACGFADDLILLSPGRKGMQKPPHLPLRTFKQLINNLTFIKHCQGWILLILNYLAFKWFSIYSMT